MDLVGFDDRSVKDDKTAVCTNYVRPTKKAPIEIYFSAGAFFVGVDGFEPPTLCL